MGGGDEVEARLLDEAGLEAIHAGIGFHQVVVVLVDERRDR